MSRAKTTVEANFRNAKVLIVEDNDDQWEFMNRAWQECLREVTLVRVATIQQAMSQLEEWCYQEWEIPKLILLELYVPTRANGWQFLSWIKAMPNGLSLIPVVILSASDDRADIEQSYSLGISAYSVKPTEAPDWLTYFQALRSYWWETVTLPPITLGH